MPRRVGTAKALQIGFIGLLVTCFAQVSFWLGPAHGGGQGAQAVETGRSVDVGRPGDGRHPLGPPLRRQMAQDAQRVNQCADRPGRGGFVAHEGRSSFGMPFSIEKN